MAEQSVIIKVYLRPHEVQVLDRVRNSANGARNRSEMIRYMIVREGRRRSKLRSSVVPESEISTDFRRGRPRVVKESSVGSGDKHLQAADDMSYYSP